MTSKPVADEPLLRIDFGSGSVHHRRKFGGGLGQALPRAVGLKATNPVHVIDATAGLGRDAFLLASLGATVTMIERSPKVAHNLKEAMERAMEDPDLNPIISRMTLKVGDAQVLLPDLPGDVVLIDPMHPDRKSSALVKQEMRILRQIVGDDPDSATLIAKALQLPVQRVVVKWPRKGDLAAGIPPPSHSLVGKSTRYDVWMINSR